MKKVLFLLFVIAFGASGIVSGQVAGDTYSEFGDWGMHRPYDFAEDSVLAIAVQADKKILYAGGTKKGGYYDFFVTRLFPDGKIDESFGNSGVFSYSFQQDDVIHDIAIQPDGKILLTGFSYDGQYRDLVVIRLDTDGQFDSDFEGGGMFVSSPGSMNYCGNKIVIRPNGNILIAGYRGLTSTTYLALQLLPDGSLDFSFGTGGYTYVPMGTNGVANSVALLSDGRAILAGTSDSKFGLVCLETNGSLSAGFGSGGKIIQSLGTMAECHDVVIDGAGKILTTGYSGTVSSRNLVVARFLVQGSLDNSFGGIGFKTISHGMKSEAFALALQNDGKILIGGYTNINGNNDVLVVRFKDNGDIDSTFNYDGIAEFPISYQEIAFDFAYSAGHILTAGTTTWSGMDEVFVLKFIGGAPYVAVEADDQILCSGSPLTIGLAVTGNLNSYIWKRDGNVVPGQISDTLTLGTTTIADAGLYTCEITNSEGSTVSKPVNIAIADDCGYIPPFLSLVNDTTLCGDTIIVDGIINIASTATVTICPGTHLFFRKGTSFNYDEAPDCGGIISYGRIIANGTPSDSIYFTTFSKDGYWGGIHMYGDVVHDSTGVFRYSVIENSASITSLPLCTLEAAITLQDGEKSKFEHCAIRNNETAGISTSNQNETQFLNCVIRNNGYYGYHSDNSTNADFRNTLFANQDFHANLQNESSADFTNVTFAGGQYATFGWASSPNVNLTNCIVYTNSTDPLNGEVGSINAENCLIKTDDTYELGGSANCIFNIFPEFSDTANGNYSLKACSPAMNAGTPDTTGLNLGSDDVDGNPRVFAGLNDVIDIGAYEYQGEPNLKPVAGFGKCLSQYIGASDSCFVELTNKTTDFTYEIWAKTTSYDYGQLFLHASDLGETTNALLMTSSGWVEFFAGVGGQSKGSLMSERSINDGQWHHLAVTAQGEIFTLYIDGVFEGSTTITDNISYDTFIVGNNDVGEEFIGEIDEVRVWDYARPLSEILEDMHHPISGTEPGLALYLPFDNLDGVNVPDYGPSTKIVTRVGLATLIDSDNPIVYYGKSGEDFSGSLPSYDPEADIETFSIVGSIEGMTLEPSSGNFTVFKEYQEDVQYFYQVEANGEASNVQSVIFKSTMPVAGSITQNTTWCIDSIIILQSVRVGNGVTLDICPGVEVIAEDSCGIFVDGRLLAIGTEDEPISFTCYPWNEYPNSIGWQGISFPNTPATNDTSKLIHCLIQRAYKENGYITTSGGGLFVSNTSKLIIDNSTFYANWAEGMGGGIYLNNASPIIRNSMISSNYADYGAGIAFENGSAPTILNTHITNNSANYDGGAMCVYYSSPKFIFCNISYNDYMLGTATVYNNNSTTTISSSILWENDSPVIEEYSGTVSVTYSDIQETNPGIGNINSDPLFISPPPMRGAGGALPLAKPVQGPSGADWHLSNCSPVINIGNPADVSEIDVDLDGNERVRNGLPDMGPYETYTDASIVDAPANTIACENAFVEFYVDAEGESNTYIWKKEGVVVKTSTDPWYDLYNVTTADEGWFRCVVVGACGTDSTADFSLTINPDCYYLDNGYVESDITWCYDTIYVDSQIYIMDDVTLNICPGTVLAFMSNYEIDVDGTLIAQGTEAEPIKFTVSDTTDMYFSETGGWKGLIFDNSTTGMYGAMDDNPGSVLEYCEFEFAKKGSGGLFVEKIGADTMIGISGSAINVLHFDNLLISNCTFTMNFAEGFGGALCIQDTSNIQVVGNQFLSNFAGIGGGAVCILESSPVFRNNILTDNNSDGDGGALWVSSCSSDLTNNLIANNDATQRGGGIYVVDGSGGMRLINNTLANNSAGVEASNLFLSACTPVITNTVIWSATTGSIVTASGANPDVIHCNIKGGINEFGGGFTGAYINNIDADPLFVNSGSRDYNIEIASPCVDAGTPDTSGLDLGAFDLAGNDRVIHDTIDIGAYETEFIPVSITLHPIAVDECVGNTAYFNVAAIGGTIAYQWYRNGALVPGETSDELQINCVSLDDSSDVYCLVSNEYESVLSNTVSLSLSQEPTIVSLTPGFDICEGSPIQLTAVIEGTGPLTIEWYLNGGQVSGQNTETLDIPVSTVADSGEYQIQVFNVCGVGSSTPSLVSVGAIPTTSISNYAPVCQGDTLYVDATGSAQSWQWNSTIEGNFSTSANPYIVSNATDTLILIGTTWLCSSSDTLAIEPKAIPDVMVTPSNLAICSGEGVNIDITTSSPGIVNFTFTANATDITGASSGIGDSIVQTLTATTSFAGTVDYSVVAEEDGCISNPVSALITVDPVFSATNVLTICSNDSVFADGSWQNTSGIYYDSLVSAAGCDSVIETQLTVNSTEFLANTASICPGDSIYLQNGWQTAAGVYYDSLLTSLSCDSVIETTVSLFTVPAFALVNDTTLTEGDTLVLTANGSWASVLWSSGSVTDTAWIHASGTYYAEVFTADGCQTSDTIVVTFTPLYQCNASFTYSVTGNTADFTNTSQGTISTTFWDFGDGQFVNDPATTFAHSFPGEGYYNVCLTIVDTLGSCFDDTCITVAVSPLPVNCNASFNYTSGGGATVLFNAGVSAGQLTNYFWDFGDGAVSYASAPTHTYPAEGYYTVELTVEDTVNDCISSKTRVIMAGDILNDCEADFTYHSMLEHKKVRFTNLSSGVNLDTYLWNFGDGSFANTPDAEHTFQTSAFYNVCLSVLSTSTGCANITCKTIKVGNDDHSCHATFVYAVDSTESKSSSGKKVDFKGTAFGDPAKTVWSILWNFGDGETDTTTLTPTHVYADSGLYQVTLKISSSYCTDLYFDLVNAGDWLDQIRGGFVYEIDTTSKSNQYPVDFKGAAFGDPAVISWEFGDGGMDSTTLSPNYVYAQPGDYNVCFTVADPNTGQSDTYCDSLHIDEITYLNTFGRAGIAADVYPNPAKSRAIIGYYLPESADVTVSIADIYGRTVDVLADNSHAAGNHTIFWNVENLKPGIYMVIIRSADEVITKRVVITR